MAENESANSPSDQDVLLLVDDNPTNLQVLHSILAGEGYRLLVAKDGESALKVAEKAHPSLILLDIMMPPGIDGYEVCRRLLADEATRDCSVIFLSALSEVLDSEGCKVEQGAAVAAAEDVYRKALTGG